MSNTMLKAWQSWYNEADIPLQDAKGEWYDAETGHYWKDCVERNLVLEKDPLLKESLINLTAKCEKLVLGTEYSINKHCDIAEYGECIKAGRELLAYYNAAKNFKKLKKQDLVDIINKNSDVSRMFNKVKVALHGEN